MKHRYFATFLVLAAVTLMGHSVASAESIEDKEPPQVTGLTIEPAEVDTTFADQAVTVKAHITDNLSGLETGSIAFLGPGEKQQVFGFFSSFNRISGTATDGIYETTITFKRFSEAGTWKVNVVRLDDQVKNRSETSWPTLIERGLPYAVQVESAQDKEPPQVTGLTIEPAEVDTTFADQAVTVKAHITDNLSGLETGSIAFLGPGEKQQVFGFFSSFNRISGTATDGIYETTITFKRFSEAGTWKVNVVRLDDQVKNRSETSWPTLIERGLPYAVQVESAQDKEPPQVTGLTIEPAEVDTTFADQAVTVKAHITDNLSGLETGSIAFLGPGEKQQVFGFFSSFNRISGTATDGIYETTITFKRFSEAGTWKVNVVRLDDQVKNRSETSWPTLIERGLPYAVQVDPVPVTTAVTPGAGPEGGGTKFEISGAHLAGATAVNFGSTAATGFTINSSSSITAMAPAGSGPVDVTVTTPSGTSSTSAADRYRYSPPVTLTSATNPSTYGQKATLTAKVVSLGPGASSPSGMVTFSDGSTDLGWLSI